MEVVHYFSLFLWLNDKLFLNIFYIQSFKKEIELADKNSMAEKDFSDVPSSLN